MAGDFKMHRAGPAARNSGAVVAPLGTRPKQPAGRARLVVRGAAEAGKDGQASPVPEIGGPKGPEPTRYGDWERNGICYDF